MSKELIEGFVHGLGKGLGILIVFMVAFSIFAHFSPNFQSPLEKYEAKKIAEQKALEYQEFIEALPEEVEFEVFCNEDNTACNTISVGLVAPTRVYGIWDVVNSVESDAFEHWYGSRCDVIGDHLVKCKKLTLSTGERK